MGVIHFFMYVKNNFGRNIVNIKHRQTFKDVNTSIDNLMIDMNGILHTSAQKVYQYGNFKPRNPSFIKKKINPKIQQENFFKDVCQSIEHLLNVTQPKKRIIMCVDGPAPSAKMKQQRGRRFKSASEKSEEEFNNCFDQNAISPGTKLMDHLTKYIDWYIRKRITEDVSWQNIEVIFSNEKVCGEGEHRIMSYIRNYGKDEDTHCIHAADADVIMLALGSHKPNFYVLREDAYDKSNEFLLVNIGELRKDLVETIKFEHKYFDPKYAITDFVFLMFIVGNDFLPHIPSIEIIEGGIEVIMDVYKNVSKGHGHMTQIKDGKVFFVRHSLEAFMGTIAQYEKGLFEEKLNKKKSCFPDELLNKHCKFQDTEIVVDIDNYRKEYIETKFISTIDMDVKSKKKFEKQLCHEYIEGMQWVLTYYTSGVSCWNWNFKYNYAPFAFHLAKHIFNFKFVKYEESFPVLPYVQLLSIMPPKSHKLLPEPLDKLLTEPDSPLKEYCPEKVEIDLSGKHKEWQGIVLLPMIDRTIVKKAYDLHESKIAVQDTYRNKLGKSFIYSYQKHYNNTFKSYYGDIVNSKVKTSVIEL
jgi:5'-3' exonuclease